MAINYPTSLDTDATVGGGVEPDAGTSLDSSSDGHPTHSGLHKHLGDAVQQLEAKIGIGSATPVANRVLLSTVTGSSSWAQVDTNQIANSAVETAKIDNQAVTTAKIDDGAVTDDKIGSSAVTTAKINGSAVTTAKINDGAVTNAKLGGSAVTTAKINNLAVTTAKIEDDAVTAAKLHADAVTGVVVANTSDTTCNVALFESATGTLGPKTDAGITYNASTGLLALTQATASGAVSAVNFVADAGSTGTASYAFDGDSNTGMYKSASDEIGFTTGGTKRLSIGSTGVVAWTSSSALAGPLLNTTSSTNFHYVMQNDFYGTFWKFSSLRDTKEQITNVTAEDSGRWIDALQPVTYVSRWLGEGDEPADSREFRLADMQVGFIADDVLANSDTDHFAQVSDNGSGGLDPEGWKWECVIAAAVAEIKSLRARVATLEGN